MSKDHSTSSNEPSSKGFDRLKALMSAVDKTKSNQDDGRSLKAILQAEEDKIKKVN